MGGEILVGSAVLLGVILLLAVERQRNRRLERRVEAVEGCCAGNHAANQCVQGDVDILWQNAFPEEAPAEGAIEADTVTTGVSCVEPVAEPEPAAVEAFAPTYASLPERYGCGPEAACATSKPLA